MSDFPATVTDPTGRSVELTEERWGHITSGHPELSALRHLVLRTVQVPDRLLDGRWPDEEWFYLATARPSRWLKVVVRFDGDKGRIVTAFPRRSMP